MRQVSRILSAVVLCVGVGWAAPPESTTSAGGFAYIGTLDRKLLVLDEDKEQIVAEIATDPEIVKTAPHNAPVGRLDEVRAARQLDLRWRPPIQKPAPVVAS